MSRKWRSDDTSPWLYGFGDGSDGNVTISSSANYNGANAGCSGTSGGNSLTLDAASTFADGDLVLIHQTRGTGVGEYELNKISSGGGSTSLTMVHNLENTYTDSGASQAQIVELKQYNNYTINGSQTVSAPDWDGNKGGIVAFLVKGIATITGNISGSAFGFRGGAQTGGIGNAFGFRGEGTTGDNGTRQGTANGNGGGGGTEPSHNAGSGGANGATGTSNSTGTGGGAASGNAGLTSLTFGGGGGGGAGGSGGGDIGAKGGDGGGIICVFAQSLTITGSVITNGEAGANGGTGAGGGGAGGSILYKCVTATLGSTLSTALAGAAGTGGNGLGGAGSVGRVHIDYSTSFTGTSNPTIDSRQDLTIIQPIPSSGGIVYAFFM